MKVSRSWFIYRVLPLSEIANKKPPTPKGGALPDESDCSDILERCQYFVTPICNAARLELNTPLTFEPRSPVLVRPGVVRKHVETAVRQRDIRTAHRRLIEDALRQHQDDLMSVVRELFDVVQVAPPEVDVGGQESGNQGLELRSSVAYRDASGYVRLELEIEARRTWGLLRQHISADPLWDAITKWREVLLRDLNERLRLWEAIWEKAEHETGYKILDIPGDAPYLTHFYPRLIYQEVAHRLLGIDYTLVVESAFEAEAEGSVWFEMGARKVVVAKAPGNEKHCTDTLLRLIDERVEWSEAEEFRRAYEEAARVAQKGRAILEDIQLLHFIPGQCATCRRLGL